jgi:hypothetical protein
MKKVLIILFFVLLRGCFPFGYITQYEKTFAENNKADSFQEMFISIQDLRYDSIPVGDWITTYRETEKGYSIERGVFLKKNNKIEYLFIHTTYINYDTVYYEYKKMVPK